MAKVSFVLSAAERQLVCLVRSLICAPEVCERRSNAWLACSKLGLEQSSFCQVLLLLMSSRFEHRVMRWTFITVQVLIVHDLGHFSAEHAALIGMVLSNYVNGVSLTRLVKPPRPAQETSKYASSHAGTPSFAPSTSKLAKLEDMRDLDVGEGRERIGTQKLEPLGTIPPSLPPSPSSSVSEAEGAGGQQAAAADTAAGGGRGLAPAAQSDAAESSAAEPPPLPASLARLQTRVDADAEPSAVKTPTHSKKAAEGSGRLARTPCAAMSTSSTCVTPSVETPLGGSRLGGSPLSKPAGLERSGSERYRSANPLWLTDVSKRTVIWQASDEVLRAAGVVRMLEINQSRLKIRRLDSGSRTAEAESQQLTPSPLKTTRRRLSHPVATPGSSSSAAPLANATLQAGLPLTPAPALAALQKQTTSTALVQPGKARTPTPPETPPA